MREIVKREGKLQSKKSFFKRF